MSWHWVVAIVVALTLWRLAIYNLDTDNARFR